MRTSAPRRLWLLATLIGGAALAAACTDACMQIQDQICLCQGSTQTEQSTCQSNAGTQESNVPPTNAQVAYCSKLLPECTDLIDGGSGCSLLQTDHGKEVCGLIELPDGGLLPDAG